MTRLATWNLVPSLPVVLRRIQNGGRQIGKAINRGLFSSRVSKWCYSRIFKCIPHWYHNITICLSTLKRRLRAYGLRRVRLRFFACFLPTTRTKHSAHRKTNRTGYQCINQVLQQRSYLQQHLFYLHQLFFICRNIFICRQLFLIRIGCSV